MPNFDRALWRTACRVVMALEAQQRLDLAVTLPNHSWSTLQTLARQLSCASRRGWRVAAQSVHQSLHLQLRWLVTDVQALVRETQDVGSDLAPRVRDVFEDLCALQTRFDQVEIDLAGTKISVTTEPITLDDVALGPFRIVWNWSRLAQGDALNVFAEEPNHPASRDDITHPHVQEGVLCEGEAQRPLRLAARSGRLLDYFEIVERVLQTYNSGSAYVSLAEWNGHRCQGCDDTVDGDDLSCCEDCDDQFCSDCQTACTTCGCVTCSGCAACCVQCQEPLCGHCRSARRGLPICDACFTKESSHDVDQTPTLAAAEAADELAVHAAGLGEALVSPGCR
jgi:hypothetical protein